MAITFIAIAQLLIQLNKIWEVQIKVCVCVKELRVGMQQ